MSWVFPFKETLETFVAGTVFAVASNLVLIGLIDFQLLGVPDNDGNCCMFGSVP